MMVFSLLWQHCVRVGMDACYYMYMSMGSQVSILSVFRTFCLHFCHESARTGHCCASREPDTQPLPIPVTKKKKIMSPMPPTIKPGTKKDQAQGELGVVAQNEGIIAPGMFPIAVRDVHTPIKSPRLERGKTEEEEHYFITFGSPQCAEKGVSACLYEQKG